jgi:hypothetical protein
MFKGIQCYSVLQDPLEIWFAIIGGEKQDINDGRGQA